MEKTSSSSQGYSPLEKTKSVETNGLICSYPPLEKPKSVCLLRWRFSSGEEEVHWRRRRLEMNIPAAIDMKVNNEKNDFRGEEDKMMAQHALMQETRQQAAAKHKA
nr:hypothetical protein Itr_chr14CG13530 [Ipomoea trifida]